MHTTDKYEIASTSLLHRFQPLLKNMHLIHQHCFTNLIQIEDFLMVRYYRVQN